MSRCFDFVLVLSSQESVNRSIGLIDHLRYTVKWVTSSSIPCQFETNSTSLLLCEEGGGGVGKHTHPAGNLGDLPLLSRGDWERIRRKTWRSNCRVFVRSISLMRVPFRIISCETCQVSPEIMENGLFYSTGLCYFM